MTTWTTRLIIILLAIFTIYYGNLQLRIQRQQVQIEHFNH